MNAWSKMLLMANLVCLTVLTSLIAYQMWEARKERTALDAEAVTSMIASVEEKLEGYARGVGTRLDDVEASRLSDEALREVITSGIESALAETPLSATTDTPAELPSTYSIEFGDKARRLLQDLVSSASTMGTPGPSAPAPVTETDGAARVLNASVSKDGAATAKRAGPTESPTSIDDAPGDVPSATALPRPKEPGTEQKLQEIHFNFASAELTPGAQRKTLLAAASIKDMAPSKVRVMGFADTAGDPALNEALSAERANAVAKMLRSAGVPADKIEIAGRGEVGVPEPTDDNVREPLNRCVGIIAVQ